jgi:beta-lactamase class D
MLFLRALASFLACPALVAGLLPFALVRDRPVHAEWLMVSAPVLGLGLIGLLWCVRDFYVSGRGTLAPWDPPKRLVIVGLYRFTRNPMYVAVLTILIGWSLLYQSGLLAGFAVVMAIVFHLRVLLHEERWLKQQFGIEWDRYAARVPRWLPSASMRLCVAIAALMICAQTFAAESTAKSAPPVATESCFLLYEIGVGERRRNPAEACGTRLSPASTFKIPHALAALDSGVIGSIDTQLPYDGRRVANESWRRDHTLRSAMHHSVLWYFQRIAERLGATREQEYLDRFDYGNKDPSSGLTIFWLGQSLQITPEEQLAFLRKLYDDGALPVKATALDGVRTMLIQPRDVVINAVGEHPFNAPWPASTVVSAKTGSANDTSGRGIRWLVGHIKRGDDAFLFVSCVVGTRELGPTAAIDLAARALREERVL